MLSTAPFAKLHVKVSSIAHVLVKRTRRFFVIPLNAEKSHHTNTFPSDWTAIVYISKPFAKLHVKVSSVAHVLVKRTRRFFVIPLNTVKSHHTSTFPSGWSAILFILKLFGWKVHVKVSSNAHVLVKRANLLFDTPFIDVNHPHTNTLPSGWSAMVFIILLAKLHVKVWSTHHELVTRTK